MNTHSISLTQLRSSLLLVCFLLLLAGCDKANQETAKQSTKKETWVTEEVLIQLGEIKTELATIKKQQAEINDTLSKLPVAGGRPAEPVVASVDLKTQPAATAKVAMIEFTDYQCPYCARHAKTVLPQLRKDFIDKGVVHYEVRHFPLGFHQQAKGAAIAVSCMPKAQFTAMHDWVFNNPSKLNKPAFITQAKVLGVNEATFIACLDNPASATAVEADMAYGERVGVSGTPKFFIGKVQGNKIVDVTVIGGAAELGRFEAAIKSKL